MNDNPTNLPMIAPKSPLAEGATVNLRVVGEDERQCQLRVWIGGAPVENSLHPTAMDAMKKLAGVLIDRMGGQSGLVGALLGAMANAERKDIEGR